MLVKRQRGTYEETKSLVRPNGSLIINDEDNNLLLHDGIKVGGYAVTRHISLDGPTTIFPDEPVEYTIVNYDNFATYEVSLSVGQVQRNGAVITVTPNDTVSEIVLRVSKNGIAQRFTITVDIPVVLQGIYTQLNSGPNPSASNPIASIGNKIYVSGGALNLWVYDLTDDTWTQLANMPVQKTLHTAVAIDGKIYICGGTAGAANYDTKTYVYDPATNQWTQLADMPVGRQNHTAVAINGKMYVAGGEGASTAARTHNYVYDPATNQWSTLTNIPAASRNHAAVAINGKMYITGGVSSSQNRVYDPGTNAWAQLTNIPINLHSHAAVAIDGNMYVFGGFNQSLVDNARYLKDVRCYDPLENTWTSLPDLPFDGSEGMKAAVINDKAYLFGGRRWPTVGSGYLTSELWEIR